MSPHLCEILIAILSVHPSVTFQCCKKQQTHRKADGGETSTVEGETSSESKTSNYRLVSLTSQIRKIFEAIIRDKMVEFLETHGLIKGTLRRRNAYIYFWSILKVYTIRYFSIAKLFLIALLRNNYLSPKCIGD